MSKLQKLYLSNNRLVQLPSEIGQLVSLQELYASSNQLAQLPAEIGQLASLQELRLGRCKLARLPAEIGQLCSLHTLDLSDNQLTQLPAEIGQLSKLEMLALSGSSLVQLPAEIGQLTNLKGLYLGGTSIGDVPPTLRHLCYWHFTHLPPDFFPVANWTAARILNEQNIEARRVMLEHYGEGRFIAELGAQPHQQDDYGTLYRVEIEGDEPLVVVRVRDASTDREYFLRVPPEMQTAHEAVAWTFGMSVAEYRPERET